MLTLSPYTHVQKLIWPLILLYFYTGQKTQKSSYHISVIS